MKVKLYFMALTMVALPLSGRAQDDDMYFTPSKKSKTALTTASNEEAKRPLLELAWPEEEAVDTVACYTGEMRDVDEYNRRPAPVDVVEDSQEDFREDGDYDYYDDYACSARLVRFHGCFSPYYVGWYDPWYYDYWWYDPWYSWCYSPWYWGAGWGLYSWGWGWHHGGWHHGLGRYYAWGGRRGSQFGHTRGGALAQRSIGRSATLGAQRGTSRQNTRTSTRNNTASSVRSQGQRTSSVGRTGTSSRSTGATSHSTGATSHSFGGGGSSRSGGFGGGSRGGGGGGARGGGGRR